MGTDFDRCVPFRFLDRSGRTEAEKVANMDVFTAVVAFYFLIAGYDEEGVKGNWDKAKFIKTLKDIQENQAFQAWRSEEVKNKAEARKAQEEIMAHAIAAARTALQEVAVHAAPVCNPAALPVVDQDTHREPAPQSDRVSAILELEAQRSQLDNQHEDLAKQMSRLEGRLSAKQRVDLERRRALGKVDMYKG